MTPDIKLVTIALIIPALDEMINLKRMLPLVNQQLNQNNIIESRVFVVVGIDSSSSDYEEIVRLGAIPIIRKPSNSFGDAMRSGFESALQQNPKYIIVMDADGSHNPKTIPKLLTKIEESRASVVVASRYVDGGGTANSLILRIMSRVLNKVYAIVLGINAQDISNNYKIYRAEALRNIQLKCSNFDIVEEILLEIKKKHGSDFVIEEIPDYFQERVSGKSKRHLFLFMISYGLTLIRLRTRSIK